LGNFFVLFCFVFNIPMINRLRKNQEHNPIHNSLKKIPRNKLT
jgi:hypothetical protein